MAFKSRVFPSADNSSQIRIILGDCRDVVPRMIERGVSCSALITDPPYGIHMDNMSWDKVIPGEEFWTIFKAVLYPGSPILAFGGRKTFHRLMCAMENSGLENIDTICWLRGSGYTTGKNLGNGYHTQLRFLWEPIVRFQSPIYDSPLRGLNIDECRLSSGRFPSNVVLSHDMECTGETCVDSCICSALDQQTGILKSGKAPKTGFIRNTDKLGRNTYSNFKGTQEEGMLYGDSGSASRFYYCARTAPKERRPYNNHPCVKPLKLMSWLCTLVKTPPTMGRDLIFDPFAGSGSTLLACQQLNIPAIGVEYKEEYFDIACRRLSGE